MRKVTTRTIMRPSHPWMTWMVSHISPRSFLVIEHYTDEGQNHLQELSKLAEKDPEFFKYLQENDNELLDFDPDADLSNPEDEDIPMEDQIPVLTKEHLRKWQQSLLQVWSMSSLSKTHLTKFNFDSKIHCALFGKS